MNFKRENSKKGETKRQSVALKVALKIPGH